MPFVLDALESLAAKLAARLSETQLQLVLAESCTAGLVSAVLGGVPGISKHLCGSAVVYQEATKTAWLGVTTQLLAERGAVSAETAAAMTSGALEKTPHANLAAAVTGHLGPDAPPELDGIVYIAIQRRASPASVRLHRLTASDRRERQQEAAGLVLDGILAAID